MLLQNLRKQLGIVILVVLGKLSISVFHKIIQTLVRVLFHLDAISLIPGFHHRKSDTDIKGSIEL